MAGGGTEPYIIDPKYRMVEGAARIYEGGAPTLTGRDYKELLMVTRDVGLDVIANTILVGNTNPSGKGMNGNCYSSDGVNPTLTTNKGEGNKVAIPIGMIDDQGRLTKKVSPKDCVGTLRSESHGNEQKVVIPVLTPDRANKHQNGRRFKEDGEEAFTLTGQDRHGVAVEVNPEVIGGIGEKDFGKQYREGNRVYDGDKIATALKASNVGNTGGASNLYAVEVNKGEGEEHYGIFVQISENLTVYAVWYPKKQCYVAIRKLTPKECFRLQGWSDDYFEKAQFVNSDSQLYKQAGNGVTVSVIREIAKKIEINN